MKALLLLLLLPAVYAHGIAQGASGDVYEFELTTLPEELEPGAGTLILHVLRDGQPVSSARTWVRIAKEDTAYFSGVLTTDQLGAAPLNYYFLAPGTYELTVEVEKDRVAFPLHVHGEQQVWFGVLGSLLALSLLVWLI